jgi:hypothetical protein
MEKDKGNIQNNTNITPDKAVNNVEEGASVEDQLIHKFGTVSTSMFTKKFIVILIAIAALGLGSGYFLSMGGISNTSLTKDGPKDSSDIKKGMIVGSDDTEVFKDTAEGLLKAGGINGEGAFHLERPGGESQNVYLTSSIVDLSKLLDRKIKVWGETQKAKTAGWLMDVGRVEVLE